MKLLIKKIVLFSLMIYFCFSLNVIINYSSPMSVFSNNSIDEEEKIIRNEWVNFNGFYYYYGSSGEKVKNEWLNDSNDWYHVDKDGKMQISEWINDTNNDWFYVGSDGKMQKSKWIDEKYYVNSDGKMLKNTVYLIGNKSYSFDSNGIATEIQLETTNSKSNSNSSNNTNNYGVTTKKQSETSTNKSYSDNNSYSNEGSSATVYVSNKGKKYHSKPSCSRMKNPSAISESTAINRGYSPCSKCW